MEDRHRNKIMSNFQYLLDNMKLLEFIKTSTVKQCIISESKMCEIESKEQKIQLATYLLEIQKTNVTCDGQCVFAFLLEMLLKTEQVDVAKTIDPRISIICIPLQIAIQAAKDAERSVKDIMSIATHTIARIHEIENQISSAMHNVSQGTLLQQGVSLPQGASQGGSTSQFTCNNNVRIPWYNRE